MRRQLQCKFSDRATIKNLDRSQQSAKFCGLEDCCIIFGFGRGERTLQIAGDVNGAATGPYPVTKYAAGERTAFLGSFERSACLQLFEWSQQHLRIDFGDWHAADRGLQKAEKPSGFVDGCFGRTFADHLGIDIFLGKRMESVGYRQRRFDFRLLLSERRVRSAGQQPTCFIALATRIL